MLSTAIFLFCYVFVPTLLLFVKIYFIFVVVVVVVLAFVVLLRINFASLVYDVHSDIIFSVSFISLFFFLSFFLKAKKKKKNIIKAISFASVGEILTHNLG